MYNKIFPATNDVVFKRVFGDTKNVDVIKGFLSSILDIPEDEYETLTIENPFLNISGSEHEKVGILDVKVSTKSKKIIDIEIQVARMKYMRERILYYLSKMTLDQIGKGESYDKIQKVISIVIAADHVLIKENNKQHNRYVLHDKDTGSTFTDKMEVDTLDLMKEPDTGSSDTGIAKWVDFFNAKTEEDLQMIYKNAQDTAVRKAAQIVLEVNQDDDVRITAEQRENALRAYNTEIEANRREGLEEGLKQGMQRGIQKGRSEGIQEGRREGIQEGSKQTAREVAKRLFGMNLTDEQVSNISGLTLEEIAELK